MNRTVRATLVMLAAASEAVSGQTAQKIPITADLSVSNAIENPRGDYESLLTIQKIDAEGLHIVFTGPRVVKPVQRTVRRVDLETSRHYQLRFAGNYPKLIPNSTALGTSKAVLTELKTRGRAAFSCCLLADFDRGHLAGTLRRVESKPVLISVLVNDQRVQLPAIHAAGNSGRRSRSRCSRR